jgi:asparagine synthase (glutamine-hydrolysing)
MCGICGIFHFGDGRPADETIVRDMTDVIRHRGPDDDGFYFDGPLGMGMRRLSIIDLDGGAQPIAGEDGTLVTVFNGEIYNFREVRHALERAGHRFRTLSDTEVIVHAFEEWSVAGLARLNGMFGLAVWDAHDRKLVIARDPYGVKPLYYRTDGCSLWFGSEIRSILCDPSVPRAVDETGIDQFLSFTYVPSSRTAFDGISKVPPGFALVANASGVRLQRFHQAVPRLLQGEDEREVVDRLQYLIEAAVRRQMVADVPVGALLSGGVDSTTTATLMSRLADRPIDTFTVGFAGDHGFDETSYARETARRIGSSHHEIVVSAGEYADFLPLSVWHLEDLVATDSTLAYYKVCQLARQSVKVVLTGQGADEPFAGYQRHLGERYGGLYRRIPEVVRRTAIAPAVHRLPRNERLKRAVNSLGVEDPVRRMLAVWTIFDEGQKRRLYRPGRRPEGDPGEFMELWRSDLGGLDGLSQMLYSDARLSLADNLLLYGDKMAMAVSLEARVPLLDLDLMRFVESIPSSLKIRGGTRKYVLKQAVRRWIPDEVVNRKKIPFTPPIDQWFRSELTAHVRDVLLASDSACHAFFEPAVVADMIDDHVTGRHDHKRALLSLLVFELWHDQFIRPSGTRFGQALHADVQSGRGALQ